MATLSAQPCLVRDDSQQTIAFETLAGKITPKLTSIEPSGRVAIAVFPGLIPAAEREPVASALNALYKAAGKTRPLTLAVFTGEGFTAAGPFGTATAWRNAVRDAFSTSDENALPISPSRLYSIVSAPTAAFGEDWSSVVFIGALPELPPDVRDYASAWLTPRFCGQKLRLSYWNPDGESSAFWSPVANLTGGRALGVLADVLESPAASPWAEAAWPAWPVSPIGFRLPALSRQVAKRVAGTASVSVRAWRTIAGHR